MIIKFLGNEPQSRYYRFGVQNNNKTDDLIFELAAVQNGVNLAEFRPFLKMQTSDLSFADKDGNLELTPTDDGKLRLRYVLTNTVEQHRAVDMQLQFEDYSVPDVAVWQTLLFNVAFNASLPADETVAAKNPTIIQEHEQRIRALEAAPASGIIERQSRLDFPAIGESGVIYIDKTANITYRFDTDAKVYYVVGSDYNDIKIINCNGGIN